jgi:hypothetical protein
LNIILNTLPKEPNDESFALVFLAICFTNPRAFLLTYYWCSYWKYYKQYRLLFLLNLGLTTRITSDSGEMTEGFPAAAKEDRFIWQLPAPGCGRSLEVPMIRSRVPPRRTKTWSVWYHHTTRKILESGVIHRHKVRGSSHWVGWRRRASWHRGIYDHARTRNLIDDHGSTKRNTLWLRDLSRARLPWAPAEVQREADDHGATHHFVSVSDRGRGPFISYQIVLALAAWRDTGHVVSYKGQQRLSDSLSDFTRPGRHPGGDIVAGVTVRTRGPVPGRRWIMASPAPVAFQAKHWHAASVPVWQRRRVDARFPVRKFTAADYIGPPWLATDSRAAAHWQHYQGRWTHRPRCPWQAAMIILYY